MELGEGRGERRLSIRSRYPVGAAGRLRDGMLTGAFLDAVARRRLQ